MSNDTNRCDPETKAVARWDVETMDERTSSEGRWVLFTDHERVVGDLVKVVDAHRCVIADFAEDIDTLRTALAASHAEVERQAKVIESYRLQKIEADKTIAYHKARRRNSHAS